MYFHQTYGRCTIVTGKGSLDNGLFVRVKLISRDGPQGLDTLVVGWCALRGL